MARLLSDHINTERLRLRQPDAGDSRAIFQAYTQDPDVCRFMIWTPHAAESVTRDFVESCIKAWDGDGRLPYAITERDSNLAIGMIEARTLGTTIDIGYVLAKPHWGKGLMTEAIAALAESALESPGIYRIQATCNTENIPSQRALDKAGFTREGRLERYTVHPNISLEPRACFMYAKVRSRRAGRASAFS
jgi:ribosomal-protein-alanine N-acetyltransferase